MSSDLPTRAEPSRDEDETPFTLEDGGGDLDVGSGRGLGSTAWESAGATSSRTSAPADPSGTLQDEQGDLDDLLDAGLRHAIAVSETPGTAGTMAEPTPSASSTSPPASNSTPSPSASELTLDHRYVLGRELGRGGMGIVYEALDRRLGRTVAVKMLRHEARLSPERRQRFLEEAQIAGQLQHPGIVPVHDAGIPEGGRPYFVMKLVVGDTLKSRLRGRGLVGEDRERFVRIFLKVCEAVAFAHARGVIHRDLKPSNVMLGRFGEVHVMDWGLAKVAMVAGPDQETRSDVQTVRTGPSGWRSLTGAVVGTPAYMAPEQATGSGGDGFRADVFSLGAMLCEILTGAPPYRGDTTGEVHEQAKAGELEGMQRRLALSDADPALIAVVTDCLARDPEARPRDAGVLAGRIERHLASAEEQARQDRARALAERARALHERRRRRQSVAAAAAIVLALLSGGTAWLWLQRERRLDMAEREVAAQSALNRATDLRARALAAGSPSLLVLEQAMAAVSEAEILRGDVAEEAPSHRRATELRRSLAAEITTAREQEAARARDRAMADRLEDIRLIRDTHVDHALQHRRYAAAFRDFGVDVSRLSPAEAADLLSRSGIRPSLIEALDWWALACRRMPPAERPEFSRTIRETLAHLDPDPTRIRIRAAAAEHDASTLKEIAGRSALGDMPASTVAILAEAFGETIGADDAVRLYRLLHARDPSDPWTNFNLGRWLSLSSTRPLDEVLAHFMAALAATPRSITTRINIVRVYSELGRHELALPLVTEALRLGPTVAPVHVVHGRVLAGQGDLEGAEAALRRAVELDPDLAVSWNDLGALLGRRGKDEEALQAFETALTLAPGYDAARLNHVIALQQAGRAEEALGEAQRLASYAPRSSSTLVLVAKVLEHVNRPDEARRTFEQAVAVDPEDADAHHALASFLYRHRELEPAIQRWVVAVSCNPAHPSSLLGLGIALRTAGRSREALGYLERGIEAARRARPPVAIPREADLDLCLAEIRREEKVQQALGGWYRPATLAEWDDLAHHCANKGLAAQEAMLWQLAFRAAASGMPSPIQRIRAASVAVRAALGRGRDPVKVPPEERERWMRQARLWLQELIDETAALPVDQVPARTWSDLRHCAQTPELAPMREAAVLDSLSPEERAAWEKLWDALDDLTTRRKTGAAFDRLR